MRAEGLGHVEQCGRAPDVLVVLVLWWGLVGALCVRGFSWVQGGNKQVQPLRPCLLIKGGVAAVVSNVVISVP